MLNSHGGLHWIAGFRKEYNDLHTDNIYIRGFT